LSTTGGERCRRTAESSQVTKMAVEDHSLLFMMEFTTEATKFCAGRVEDGGWSDSLGESGVTKLTAGKSFLPASLMICVEGAVGALDRLDEQWGVPDVGVAIEFPGETGFRQLLRNRVDVVARPGEESSPVDAERLSTTPFTGDRQPEVLPVKKSPPL